MHSNFDLKPDEKGYVLSREGQGWQASFKTIQEALQYAARQPNCEGAKVIVRSEKGIARLEFEL